MAFRHPDIEAVYLHPSISLHNDWTPVCSALGQGLCCLECKMRMSLFLLEGFQLNQLIRSSRFSLRHSVFPCPVAWAFTFTKGLCVRGSLSQTAGSQRMRQATSRWEGKNPGPKLAPNGWAGMTRSQGGLTDHKAILAMPSLLQLFTLRTSLL